MSSPTVAQPSSGPRHRPLWRNRDFMLLWSGQTVSTAGSQVSQIAFPLLILAITHSPALAGFAGALRTVPYVVFSLPVGALIDRWDRKRVMMLCDAGRAVALGSIPVALALGRLTLAQIFAVALVEGTLYVFFNIAEVACLPRVVPTEQLPEATAQNQATDSVASLVGPSLAGVLYQVERLLPFVADAVSYAVSVATLALIRTDFQEARSVVRRRLRTEIGEGLAWLWGHPLIRYIAFLTGGLNLVTAGFTLMLIVILQGQHASPAVIGFVFAVEGIGSIIGAIVAPLLQKRMRFGTAILASLWAWMAIWPFFAFAPTPLWIGVLVALFGLTGPLYNVVQFSYRMALIPDALQGRVNSVFRLLAFGLQPLGLALTGWLLQVAGAEATVLLLGVVMLALTALTSVNQHVRKAGAPAVPPA